MRLSTDPARDDARSEAVLTAALDAGVNVLDTADAYARDDTELGHNERLIAKAIAGRDVRVVTKGGLERPGGAWVPNGRAKHLDEAARASRARLGVEAIDLYLLHAIDPKVPLATSVRALAKLRDAGVVRAIGLSNVGVHQLEQALAITKIDAVEVELHPWKLDALRGGLVAACEQRGIELLAHRPLGGVAFAKRVARDKALDAIGKRLGATPAEVILAWLRSLSPVIVPLPGPTRIDTAQSCARVLELDEAARAALAARFVTLGDAAPSPSTSTEREVVIIAGMPGAGKSTLAAGYVARGYQRLNRDDRGGSLVELARALDQALSAGRERVVLDNTYGTRASRATVIEIAKRHGVPVRCLVLATTIEQAQTNAAARIIERHGRLPGYLRDELLPSAQFRYRRTYEPPRIDEGFTTVEEVPFERVVAGGQPALIVDLDTIVWQGRARFSGELILRDGMREALAAWSAAGFALAGTIWQPGHSADVVKELAERLSEKLELAIDIACCPHPGGPPKCWCRKPLPGLGLVLARKHHLDLSRSVHVGRGPADRGFADRLGMRYVDFAGGFPAPAAT
jgi:aryl-alcohol dehydrogenase-like predicted oxidoreductase/predicted kinase/histidinol phosphatase-like enzyme